jgi:hypothetical protein
MTEKLSLRETAARFLRRLGRFPGFVTTTPEERRRQALAEALEAERLDRLRHPSNYVGK